MKTLWGSGGIAPPFVTSALDAGEWSASRPGRFTPGEIALGTHWIGGWVGPRCDKDKNLALAKIRTPVIQPVARSCTD
jgi:hypothetical protein